MALLPSSKKQKKSESYSFFDDGGVRGHNPDKFDQFFTNPSVAADCVKQLQEVIKCDLNHFECILEPSFGNGAFVTAIQNVIAIESRNKLIYFDIDAKNENLRKDFLNDIVIDSKYMYNNSTTSLSVEHPTCLTIGNPPFGKNSSLAIAFFNRAASFSDVVAFILPRTFRKSSVQNKLNRAFFLVHETLIPPSSFSFMGKSYDIPCVFQIWSHVNFLQQTTSNLNIPHDKQRPIISIITSTLDFKFVDADDIPDIAIRRVGVNAGRIIQEFPSRCSRESHLFLSFLDKSRRKEIIANLKSLNLEQVSCKFDTAGCPSISKSEICMLYINNK